MRRGDVISEGAAQKIQALGDYARTVDVNRILGSILFLLLVFAVACYLLSFKSATLRRGRSS